LLERVGTGDEYNQPAGFEKDAYFESLHVSYRAPVKCSCPGQGDNTRYLHMTVDYDKSNNSVPELRVEETQADGSPKPGDPDKNLKPRITQQPTTDYRGRKGLAVVAEVKLFIPCKCSDVNPCETTFTLYYTYVATPF
jgi:hypothetical protein